MQIKFLQTLTISHTIIKGLDGSAETSYTYDFEAHLFSNLINVVIQTDAAKNCKLDTELNIGLRHFAAKHYLIGASYRL